MRKSIKKQIKTANQNTTQTHKKVKGELKSSSATMSSIRANAAGIDIGSRSHFVAIPDDNRKEKRVREFEAFTTNLKEMVQWLKECHIDTVAMEATGVYWIPLYEILEQNGFEVLLVNASHVKNVPGRPKSDVLDCQWIQRLHEVGLLRGAFRPADEFISLRSYVRQRSDLIAQRSEHSLRMQKALTQMNLQLNNVIRDITGISGMLIIRAMISGERNPIKLAQLADRRCNNPKDIIAKSLEGNFRQEHMFALKQAVDFYDYYHQKIVECEKEIKTALEKIFKTEENNDLKAQTTQTNALKLPDANARKISKKGSGKNSLKNDYCFDLHAETIRIAKVDLTKIPGIDASSAIKIIAEIGTDMSRWPTEKHFASWLGLCPGMKLSGGRLISGATKSCANKVAVALRMSATTLHRSKSALGAFLRRKKAQKGPAKAITATAHKMAKQIYCMLKYGEEYVEGGQEYYEKQYQERALRSMKTKASELGYDLVPKKIVA